MRCPECERAVIVPSVETASPVTDAATLAAFGRFKKVPAYRCTQCGMVSTERPNCTCDASYVHSELYSRVTYERITFVALGTLLLGLVAMIGTRETLAILIGLMLPGIYWVGSYFSGIGRYRQFFTAEIVQLKPWLLQRFYWPRFFMEFVYSIGIILTVAVASIIAHWVWSR